MISTFTKRLGLAGVALAGMYGIASAQTPVTAVTDLNVRSGPGSQYPIVGVINAGEATSIRGCIRNAKWCAVDEGFVYSDYLTADIGGSATVITNRYEDARIVYVDPPAEGSIQVIDGATGSIDDQLIGRVDDVAAVEPPETVRTYVTANRVDPVYLDGEVVVGAGLPDRVVLRQVPDYNYEYVYVNGQTALVDPGTRRIVYVYR